MGSLVERQFPRAACEARVSGESEFGRFYAAARDIGLGGVCFETDYPLNLGEALGLGLRLPGRHGAPLAVTGRVGWIEPGAGVGRRVGVVFEPLSPQALKAIKRFVAASLTPSQYPRGALNWPLLFSHYDLGPLRLKNRIVMAPMFWGYAHRDGTISQPLIDRYREIAWGGVAMIVVANAIVAPDGAMSSHALRIDEDQFIPGLAELAQAIKEAGCVPCLQLNHAGRFARGVDEPLSPSPVSLRNLASEMAFLGGDQAKLGTCTKLSLISHFFEHLIKCRQEMSPAQIEATVTSFAEAARRAKQAGFEAVELHGATGYLLTQFLSGRTNHRQDEYGGSLEGRMRFPLEVVSRVQEAVGPGFPVGYRFLADELLPGGLDLAQARVFAQGLESLGVSYLSVTGATYESMFLPQVVKTLRRPGGLVPLAAHIKQAVGVPVITAGRIGTPRLAEEVLEAGQADLIGLARGLFVDPNWPRKVLEGRDKEIRHCRGCNQCLISVIKDEPVVCSRWEVKKRVATRVSVKGDRKWSEVLIAIDGSDTSLAAVEYAGRLLAGGNDYGKTVTLFHVRPAEDGNGNGSALQHLQELLAQAAAILANAGFPEGKIIVKTVPEQSGVASEIIREIEQGNYGLVIMGRRGLSNSRRLLFGGVSRSVIQQARDCAVCILD